MPSTMGAGQRGSFAGGAVHAAAVPVPQVLVAAFAQHGAAAARPGIMLASGLAAQTAVPHITLAAAVPAAPPPAVA
jgi:hypothetical protein